MRVMATHDTEDRLKKGRAFCNLGAQDVNSGLAIVHEQICSELKAMAVTNIIPRLDVLELLHVDPP
jgi:ureidoglycolate hydrolase